MQYNYEKMYKIENNKKQSMIYGYFYIKLIIKRYEYIT